MSDRPGQPMLEGWTLGTAVLMRSERIRPFHDTLNVPFRHPSVLATEAAALDLPSDGHTSSA
jgi:alkanesulfonate monooxygenase SsuD/methylene tetrahydromethanopterin reductase-like flavin-dependent oxidoreductase (luciferase family)